VGTGIGPRLVPRRKDRATRVKTSPKQPPHDNKKTNKKKKKKKKKNHKKKKKKIVKETHNKRIS